MALVTVNYSSQKNTRIVALNPRLFHQIGTGTTIFTYKKEDAYHMGVMRDNELIIVNENHSKLPEEDQNHTAYFISGTDDHGFLFLDNGKVYLMGTDRAGAAQDLCLDGIDNYKDPSIYRQLVNNLLDKKTTFADGWDRLQKEIREQEKERKAEEQRLEKELREERYRTEKGRVAGIQAMIEKHLNKEWTDNSLRDIEKDLHIALRDLRT